MATKIRLQRHGRKGYAYYHIVVADSRAPRNGKFIERIGSYNPNTNPATVELNFERALYWTNAGAQPTDTTRNILSDEGVLMMKHLEGGVKKGAFDEAEAAKRFETWKTTKEASKDSVKAKLSSAAQAQAKERLAAETAKNEAKAAELAKKRAEESAALAAAAVDAAKEAAAAAAPAPAEETPVAE
jgi:small subunit ribosomal protein S16